MQTPTDAAAMDALMSLLRPEAVLSKIVAGGGRWGVRKPRYGDPAFCLMLEGSCVLELDGLDPIELRCGDFLLLPETPGFALSGSSGVKDVGLELFFTAGILSRPSMAHISLIINYLQNCMKPEKGLCPTICAKRFFAGRVLQSLAVQTL